MSRSLFVPFLAAAFLIVPAALGLSGSALAQKTPTTDAINLNSSKSNVDRMGGGGGGRGGAARTTTVKSSKSNTSDRMGGGGGTSKPKSKALNPQPEPPGRR